MRYSLELPVGLKTLLLYMITRFHTFGHIVKPVKFKKYIYTTEYIMKLKAKLIKTQQGNIMRS